MTALLDSPQLQKLADRFTSDGSLRGVTALRERDVIWNEFVLDSLVGLDALPAKGRVIDIGTGGGIPGLVLAIARPDLQFVLADSASKKTKWVSELVSELDLENVDVVTMRLELLGRDKNFRGQFDAVTAKALASLNVLLEFAMPLLKVDGHLIAYKGPALADEIKDAGKALTELKGEVVKSTEHKVGEKLTNLCEIVKTATTPDKYPRRDGVPQKKPLRGNT